VLVTYFHSSHTKHTSNYLCYFQERLSKGIELVGDEDVARALIVACGGAYEPVVAVYDKLLTNGAVVPSLNLKLCLLRSILVVLREWVSTVTGSVALTYYTAFWMDRTSVINQGVRDKIISLANRFVSGLLLFYWEFGGNRHSK
jgi:nuclear pore complex protein Nup155